MDGHMTHTLELLRELHRELGKCAIHIWMVDDEEARLVFRIMWADDSKFQCQAEYTVAELLNTSSDELVHEIVSWALIIKSTHDSSGVKH